MFLDADGSMTPIVTQLPQENGRTYGFHKFLMTSINYHSQLMMFGGYADVPLSDIWKFTLANRSWEFMGNLPATRFEMTGFSVTGLSC
jgi:hypothetical protein